MTLEGIFSALYLEGAWAGGGDWPLRELERRRSAEIVVII